MMLTGKVMRRLGFNKGKISKTALQSIFSRGVEGQRFNQFQLFQAILRAPIALKLVCTVQYTYYTYQETHISVHMITSRLYWYLVAMQYIPSLVGQQTVCEENRFTLDLESHEKFDLNNIFKTFPPTGFLDIMFAHFDLYLSKIKNGILFSLSSNSFRF